MTKLFLAALAIGVLGLASTASAACPGHQQTVSTEQTVVDSSGADTEPMTPLPTEEKTGG